MSQINIYICTTVDQHIGAAIPYHTALSTATATHAAYRTRAVTTASPDLQPANRRPQRTQPDQAKERQAHGDTDNHSKQNKTQ